MKTKTQSLTLLNPPEPVGMPLVLARLRDDRRFEARPNALFKDQLGRLYLGSSGEDWEIDASKPVRLVSPLEGLRWVRDNVSSRRLDLMQGEPFLIDVAVEEIQRLDYELVCECHARSAVLRTDQRARQREIHGAQLGKN